MYPTKDELVMPIASRNFLIVTSNEMGGELAQFDKAIAMMRARGVDPAIIEVAILARNDHYRVKNAMFMIGSTKLQADPPTNPPSPPQPTLRQRFARWLLGV